MSTVRDISTMEVKPASISTLNTIPSSVSSIQYAGKYTTSNKYGDFKYGTTNKYGATTLTSLGQKMPSINTKEI